MSGRGESKASLVLSNTRQPDLFSAHGSADRRPVVDHLVDLLLHVLRGRGWTPARVLGHELGVDDRAVREAASRSTGHVISGQRGYHLTREASLEDVEQATRWLRSQGAAMQRRAYQIDRVRHGRIGSAA